MKTRIILFSLLLGGCLSGPAYHPPSVTLPAAYKENWKSAEPNDTAVRGNWWESYGDTELNSLVKQVEISNQNIAAAAAQYRQAMALLGASRASNLPTLTGGLSDTRSQGASTATSVTSIPARNSVRLSLSASWEADLWGHVARTIEVNDATAQAGNADLQSALLSAQATLVQSYFQLRSNEAQQQLLQKTITAYQRSLEITKNRQEAGVAARIDVVQAQTQLKTTEAQLIDLGVQQAQLEHALAVLIGKAPADFQLAPVTGLSVLPSIPLALPSALLERRPDIAAAERRMAAANAQIGVTESAFFPTLTLGGSVGYQNSGFAQLLSLPDRFWSIGPSLALTLFDAGARSSQKEAAIASYDKSVATYRQTILAAFQEVEDNLAALRQLTEEARAQQAAVEAAAEALTLTENQYRTGIVSYLNVITAQAASLNAQRSSLDIAGRRLLASAMLIKALGGNWSKMSKQ